MHRVISGIVGLIAFSLSIPLIGYVLSGPPPRPLDRRHFRIGDGDLMVNYRDFMAGTRKKVPL